MIEIIPNWHPIFVHFTVALFSLSVGLFAITPYMKGTLKEHWLIVARWALWFGIGISVITVLTGLYAYNTVDHDTASHAAMTDHRNWAIVTITVFLLLAAWSITHVKRAQTHGIAFVIAMLAGGGLLGSTAWHGGEAVYRFGLGVMSLPKVEGKGHAHEHADGEGHGDSKPSTKNGAMEMSKDGKSDHDNSDGHHDEDANGHDDSDGHHDKDTNGHDDSDGHHDKDTNGHDDSDGHHDKKGTGDGKAAKDDHDDSDGHSH